MDLPSRSTRRWYALVAAACLGACAAPPQAPDDGRVRTYGQPHGYFPPAPPRLPALTSHCSPAPALFASSAFCICDDLTLAGRLVTRATEGDSGDLAVCGRFSSAVEAELDGSLRVSGDVSTAGTVRVSDHVHAAGDVSAAGTYSVGGDLGIAGRLDGAGSLTVGGTLRTGGAVDYDGPQRLGARGDYVDPGGLPCGCDAASRYDVAAAVRAAKTANDNAREALPLDAAALVGTTALRLRTGRYFLANARSVGSLTLEIDGDVQLYLEGDLDVLGTGQVELSPGASLDLFVSGRLTTVGEVSFGDTSRPDAFRLFLGGQDAALTLAGSAGFHGLVYAPEVDVTLAGQASVLGGLVAHKLSYAGELLLSGARAWSQPAGCEEPDTVPTRPQYTLAAPR